MKHFVRMGIFLLILTGQTMAGVFNPQMKTLSNGLQVIVIPNTMAPIVSVGVLYKVGTADDPSDITGISHFLEHMMFKGTTSVPTAEFKRIILEHGGETNALTSFDYTLYHTDIAVEYLELILKMEADRMANLAFTEKEVAAERDVVLEERRMRLDNHPFGQAYETLLRALRWYHPYGVPPIGHPYHIQNYTYQAVRDHYHKWYTPNNAVLMIAGKTTLEQVLPLVEKYFGGLNARPVPERIRIAEPSHQGITQHIEQKNPRNSLILLNWYYEAPNHRSDLSQHCYPLMVLSQVLGGNSTTDFYRFFVEDKKLALNISSSYDDTSYDPQFFSLSATLAPNMDVNIFKKELALYLQKLLATISDAEVEKAKRDLLAQLAFMRDGNKNSLMVFTSLAAGLTVEQIEKWGDSIKAVTAEQVLTAARIVLGKPALVTMDLYPGTDHPS